MWFCFFPLLSEAIQEHYWYSFGSSKQPGKENPLMDMDKKERTATVLLLKVPPESWSRKKAVKGTKKKECSALSKPETKQCPLLAPAIEENSCLCRQIDFFFSFSCHWTLQTTGCWSPAETLACAWDYAAKSKGVSWPFRQAVTGALSWGQ